MMEGNLGRFDATDQKLDRIIQQCHELEGLIRAFVATRVVAPAPAQRMDQNQSIAFLERRCSSEYKFRGGAHKVFDGMHSKEIVLSSSEIPEFRSTMIDEETTSFNLGGSINSQVQDRTLLVKIHLMEYRISCDVLELVFSRFGTLEDVEILSAETRFHSRIRFTDRESTIDAFNALNGRNIYDGCCQMELFLDVLSEIEAPMAYASSGLNQVEPPHEDATQVEEFKELESTTLQSVSSRGFDELEDSSSETEKLDSDLVVNQAGGDGFQSMDEPFLKISGIEEHTTSFWPAIKESEKLCVECKAWDREIDKDMERIQLPGASLKVIPFPDLAKVVASDVVAYRKLGELVEDSFDCIEIGLDNFKVNSFEFLTNGSARNMFDEMPTRELITWNSYVHRNYEHSLRENWIFDPGDFIDPRLAEWAGLEHLKFSMMQDVVVEQKRINHVTPYVRGKEHFPMSIFLSSDIESSVELLGILGDFLGSTDVTSSFVFDPGGSCLQLWGLIKGKEMSFQYIIKGQIHLLS